MDLRAAERCLHDRGRLAFATAAATGTGGEFSAFEHQGLLVLLTTAPGLGLLNLVTGVTAETVGALPDVAGLFAAAGIPSWSLAAPPRCRGPWAGVRRRPCCTTAWTGRRRPAPGRRW